MTERSNMTKACADMSKASISPGNKRADIYYSKIDNETRNIPKETIPAAVLRTLQKNDNFPVLKYKTDPKGDFNVTITMKEYLCDIRKAARSFITLGLEAKASIGIIGFNHHAWFTSQFGAIFAGGVVCGIYTTNNADICKFIMNDCNCQIAVVENDEQLNKILSILPDVPHLKAIVKYTGTITEELKNKYKTPIYTWTEFLNIESDNVNAEMERRIANLKPDDCAVLIYTSGTTGLPKGVMLSHDNVLFTLHMVRKDVGIHPFKHSLISYLPLSHIAANITDVLASAIVGTTTYFAEPDALKGSLGRTLKEVRPTIFITVPRVFEKFQEQIQLLSAKKNEDKKDGTLSNNSSDKTRTEGDLKIKEALGLDRCEYMGSAAAPISIKTLEFFQNLGIVIQQIYGMSECSGPHTIGLKDNFKMGSTGCLMSGVELKIAEPDENLVGEICMRGRNVFLGYFNSQQKTKEVLDSDGWLHSGDIGKMENGEFLFVTGRIKELIITAGGENIAPVPIEDRIKEELPFISNTMLVGDHKKFISCLLTIKTVIDPETQLPTDDISPLAIREFSKIGIHVSKVKQLVGSTDPILRKFIDEAFKRVNALAISRAAYVQKWTILPRDFSVGAGELGPTLKLKRMVITETYSKLIDSLYGS